jgi:hypothetical protein
VRCKSDSTNDQEMCGSMCGSRCGSMCGVRVCVEAEVCVSFIVCSRPDHAAKVRGKVRVK